MAELDRFAKAQSDTEAAIEMQRAKRKLLSSVRFGLRAHTQFDARISLEV
jgi:hypothetical protein